jgi:hypothetical protein
MREKKREVLHRDNQQAAKEFRAGSLFPGSVL